MTKHRVYISGEIRGSYRSQNWIKAFGDLGIVHMYCPTTYFSLPKASVASLRILEFGFFLVSIPFRVLGILFCTEMLILPMCYRWPSLFEVMIAKVLGKRIVADFYVSQFDTKVNDRKICNRRSLKGRWSLFKDRLLFRFSSDLIFLSEAEEAHYSQVVGVSRFFARRWVVPLCIDGHSAGARQRRYSERGPILRVCWWGSYLPLHGLGLILEAFSRLRNQPVNLVILGNSEAASSLYRTKICQLGLENSVSIRNDLTFFNGGLEEYLVKNCDLALGNFGDSKKARAVLPNKVVDAMALGIPCLTMRTTGAAEMLNDDSVLYADATSAGIAAELRAVMNGCYDLQAISDRALVHYRENFSPQQFRSGVIKIFQSQLNIENAL